MSTAIKTSPRKTINKKMLPEERLRSEFIELIKQREKEETHEPADRDKADISCKKWVKSLATAGEHNKELGKLYEKIMRDPYHYKPLNKALKNKRIAQLEIMLWFMRY